jgi:hypothetical protein
MSNENQDRAQPHVASKRPYEAPGIEETGTFEHLHMHCGHQKGVFTCEDSDEGPFS